jgi:drug/metabolite transporter (DMT)-like permease
VTTSRAVQSPRATGIGLVAILLWAALALLTVRAGLIPPIVLMSAMSAPTGSERLRPRHLLGALLGLAGTCLVVLGQRGAGPATGSIMGYAAAGCCAVVWSSYSVVNRRFAKTPSAMIVGVCGAVALAGAACHVMFETATVWPDSSQWAAIVGLGIGPTGLAFLAWDFATKHGNLPLLGALSYLAPVISTLLLTAAGAVPASSSLFVSAFLVIAGALVATGIRLAPSSSRVSNE